MGVSGQKDNLTAMPHLQEGEERLTECKASENELEWRIMNLLKVIALWCPHWNVHSQDTKQDFAEGEAQRWTDWFICFGFAWRW